MTDKLIERIKADREAGTDGPWPIHDGINSRPIEVAGCYLAHFSNHTDAAPHQTANARRIARVPDMEARILADAKIIEAAEKLAEAVKREREEYGTSVYLSDAFRAYQAAVEEARQ